MTTLCNILVCHLYVHCLKYFNAKYLLDLRTLPRGAHFTDSVPTASNSLKLLIIIYDDDMPKKRSITHKISSKAFGTFFSRFTLQ